MVVLLIGMAVTAVWMGAMLPAWRQQALREKETELIFRGEEYARAFARFYAKNGTLPPSVDVLVQQKYLRKKYKDPVTGEDFLTILVNAPAQTPNPVNPPGRGTPIVNTPGANPQAAGGPTSGIRGVYSKSTATSIKIYQNQQAHNLWQFDYQTGMQLMNMNLGRGRGPMQPGGQPGRGGDAPFRGGPPGRGGDGGPFRPGPGIGPGGVPPPPGRGGPPGLPPGSGRGRGGQM
jgi:hypothetical protein